MLTQKRNGLFEVSTGEMDELTYVYENIANGYSKNTNKLRQIQDSKSSDLYTDDMDNQNADNYAYDAIGNLIKDDFECIQQIKWTARGKVKSVTRTPDCTTEGTPMPDLVFEYDANGNMLTKTVKPADQLDNSAEWTITYYTYSPDGNILATYIQKPQSLGGQFVLSERQIYGSSHLGTDKQEIDPSQTVSNIQTITKGERQYFLTDHRGNNNVTVTDRRKVIEDIANLGTIAGYEPVITRSVDYYSFGREMNGRVFNNERSEFGYNGKQNIAEWSARKGSVQNYGARIKIGEVFGSIDGLSKKYPWYTPYQFAGNKPIVAVDLDGKEEYIYYYEYNNGEPILIDRDYNIEWRVDEANSSSNGIATVPYNKATGKPFRKDEFDKAQYQYFDDGKRVTKRRELAGNFVDGENELMEDWTENIDGSVYIGNNNPPEVNGRPDYRREPQDKADKIGKEHDIDFDKRHLKDLGGVMTKSATPANEKAIKAADELLNQKTDEVTGKDVSEKTKDRARTIKWFRLAEILK